MIVSNNHVKLEIKTCLLNSTHIALHIFNLNARNLDKDGRENP